MQVNQLLCISCGMCARDCVASDISMASGKAEIKNERCIQCGHCIAICPVKAVSCNDETDYSMKEVLPYEAPAFTVPAENLMNFMKFRRSVRLFTTQAVSEAALNQIIEAGRYSQTGINVQDVSYIVVRDKIPQLRELTLKALSDYGQQLLEQAATPAKIKQYANIWMLMYKNYQHNPQAKDRLFYNAPALIIVKAKNTVNGALAASKMELMTDALGLGTFFSGFLARAAAVNQEVKRFLNIAPDEELVACLVIGHPLVKYHRTVPRKPAKVDYM